MLISTVASSQVTTSIDSTAIKIGAELLYKIQIKADSTALVVFSEEQTFQPLEMINSYPIDTTKKESYYHEFRFRGPYSHESLQTNTNLGIS